MNLSNYSKTIVYGSNLEPRKLAGLESQGMILSAVGPKWGTFSCYYRERSSKFRVMLII